MEKQIFVTRSKTEVKTYDVEGVSSTGTYRWIGGGLYLWVKNAESSTALTVGQTCYHEASDGADMLKNVYAGSTAIGADAGNAALIAGIVMGTSLAAGSYGWIQVLGYGEGVVDGDSVNVAVGDVLKGGTASASLFYDSGAADATQTQVTLTDSSGGTGATTLEAPYSLAQVSLTDSSGGTSATTLEAPFAITQSSLTDSTGGTATTVLVACSSTYDAAEVNANFASIAARLAEVKADIAGTADNAQNWTASLNGQLNVVKTDVAGVLDNAQDWVASLNDQLNAINTDIGTIITSRSLGRHVIALEANTGAAASKRVFVRCL
jgi:hypothetical protein